VKLPTSDGSGGTMTPTAIMSISTVSMMKRIAAAGRVAAAVVSDPVGCKMIRFFKCRAPRCERGARGWSVLTPCGSSALPS
jgi:hypothetical protein